MLVGSVADRLQEYNKCASTMPVDIEQLKGLSIEGAALSYVVSASDSCRVIVLSHLRLSPPCMLSGSILAGVVAAALWHHGEVSLALNFTILQLIIL